MKKITMEIWIDFGLILDGFGWICTHLDEKVGCIKEKIFSYVTRTDDLKVGSISPFFHM